MTVKEYLAVEESDFDIEDKEYDAIVTCCYMDEIKDDYDKFCDLLTSKVNLIRGGSYPLADWSGFIEKNLDKFKEFTNKYWNNTYEDDEEELVYQWITEFHGYMAGMVSNKFYTTLVDFFEKLEPATEEEPDSKKNT